MQSMLTPKNEPQTFISEHFRLNFNDYNSLIETALKIQRFTRDFYKNKKFDNIDFSKGNINVPVDDNLNITISKEQFDDTSKKIDSFDLQLTKEESSRLAIAICTLMAIAVLLLVIDDEKLNSLNSFLESFANFLQDSFSNFSKGVLEGLSLHELGKTFGPFVSGYIFCSIKKSLSSKENESNNRKEEK